MKRIYTLLISLLFVSQVWAIPPFPPSNSTGDITGVGDCTSGQCDSPTFTGTVTAAGFSSSKTSGVAGFSYRYEANSTDTDYVGEVGPASMTANTSYLLRDIATAPSSANMVQAVDGSAAASGSGAPADPWFYDRSWVDLDNYALKAGSDNIQTSGYTAGRIEPIVLTHASGIHDGSDDAAIMTDSGESFGTNAMVGMTVYNVTDGSTGLVTANDGTTITATLAGGTDNNWDTSDVWQVGPGPNQAGSIFYVSAASTIRHPTTIGYAAGYYVDGTIVLTIEVADAMTIKNATAAAVDAGDTIDSPATAGSLIYLHNKSATEAMSHGKIGTWMDGGET